MNLSREDKKWITRSGYKAEAIFFKKMGHFCGYVYIGRDHNLFDRVNYENDCGLECHGGITFSQISESGNQHKIGFDCDHSCDKPHPHYEDIDYVGIGGKSSKYRDIDYVKNECESLSDQLKAIQDDYLSFKEMLAGGDKKFESFRKVNDNVTAIKDDLFKLYRLQLEKINGK